MSKEPTLAALVAPKKKDDLEAIRDWSAGVIRKKEALDRREGITAVDMRNIADIAMYEGIAELHGILKLENESVVTRKNPVTGEDVSHLQSNVANKIQAANAITAMQRYLTERISGDDNLADKGTTIIFEESQQIRSADGATVTKTKKVTGRAKNFEKSPYANTQDDTYDNDLADMGYDDDDEEEEDVLEGLM